MDNRIAAINITDNSFVLLSLEYQMGWYQFISASCLGAMSR